MQMLSFVKVKPSYANEVLLRLLKGETIFYQCQPYRKCIVNGAFIHFLSFFFDSHKLDRKQRNTLNRSPCHCRVNQTTSILSEINLTRMFPCSVLLNTDDMHKIGYNFAGHTSKKACMLQAKHAYRGVKRQAGILTVSSLR